MTSLRKEPHKTADEFATPEAWDAYCAEYAGMTLEQYREYVDKEREWYSDSD